jgi:mono/diheme cytochrome c family protein
VRCPLLFSLLILFLSACSIAPHPGNAPTPSPTPVVDRLAPLPVPVIPKQADLGYNVYYQVCMACHGDRGQGLTDEWRAAWGEDSNCWVSKCHGPNHPIQGFQFPKQCPAVIGEGTLARFNNAQELHDYLISTMPWWKPGYLKKDEYWQLTAYLMRSHNALPEDVTLDEGTASVFRVHLSSPLPGDKRLEVWFIAGMLAVIAGLIALQNKLK